MGVLGLAAVLRLWGIEWGLPSVLHPDYSYHPDEAFTLTWARWLVDGQIIPKHFIYGGTFYYTILNAFVHFGDWFASSLGGINLLANSILAGRYFLVGLALLTILLLYEAGRRLFGPRVALVAALLLAINPAHVVWAQRVRVDEIAAFLAVLIFFLATRILTDPGSRRHRDYVYSGIAVGVACATRLPLALFGLLPFLAHLASAGVGRWQDMRAAIMDWRLVSLAAATVLAYAIASPHSFIYFDSLRDGLRVTMQYETDVFLDAVEMGPGIYQHGWLMLRQALGYPFYFLALAGVVFASTRRTAQDILSLAAIVPYFLLLITASWVVVRYTLPLMPFLLLLVARLVVAVTQTTPRYRVPAYVVVGLSVLWTLAADMAYLRAEAGKNIRDVASVWIAEQIPAGAGVATVSQYGGDLFFDPPLPPRYQRATYFLSADGDSGALFREPRLEYLILNEYTYRNMERLGQRHPRRGHFEFYRHLQQSPFALVKEFSQRIEFLGIDFSGSFASTDYRVLYPAIRVYARTREAVAPKR